MFVCKFVFLVNKDLVVTFAILAWQTAHSYVKWQQAKSFLGIRVSFSHATRQGFALVATLEKLWSLTQF